MPTKSTTKSTRKPKKIVPKKPVLSKTESVSQSNIESASFTSNQKPTKPYAQILIEKQIQF